MEIYDVCTDYWVHSLSHCLAATVNLSVPVFELFLGEVLDKRNFRKKIIALDQIEETGEKRESVRHRPARLHRVKSTENAANL